MAGDAMIIEAYRTRQALNARTIVLQGPYFAWARQSSTAVKMALEVTEAPETASTPSVPLAATMA